MYDLGAKMDVFLRCNAIKMFKGITYFASALGLNSEIFISLLFNDRSYAELFQQLRTVS